MNHVKPNREFAQNPKSPSPLEIPHPSTRTLPRANNPSTGRAPRCTPEIPNLIVIAAPHTRTNLSARARLRLRLPPSHVIRGREPRWEVGANNRCCRGSGAGRGRGEGALVLCPSGGLFFGGWYYIFRAAGAALG